MEQWQFLIQKQGERVWLPLESPTQEILEGRYRIVARSSRINTDVEVRIVHISASDSTLGNPPMRRVHKRSRRTNHEGLVAVMPFTYFQAGLWEICCSGNLIADVMGTPWQHFISFKVQSQVAGDENPSEEEPSTDNQGENFQAVSPASLSSHNMPMQAANRSALPTPPPPPLQKLRSPIDEVVVEAEQIDNHRQVTEEGKEDVTEESVSTSDRFSQPPVTPSINNLQQSESDLSLSPSPELEIGEKSSGLRESQVDSDEGDAIIDALLSLYETPTSDSGHNGYQAGKNITNGVVDDGLVTNEPENQPAPANAINENANTVSGENPQIIDVIGLESTKIEEEAVKENQETSQPDVEHSVEIGLNAEVDESEFTDNIGLTQNQVSDLGNNFGSNSLAPVQADGNLDLYGDIVDGANANTDNSQSDAENYLEIGKTQSLDLSEDTESVEIRELDDNTTISIGHDDIDDNLGKDVDFSHGLETPENDSIQDNPIPIDTEDIQPQIVLKNIDEDSDSVAATHQPRDINFQPETIPTANSNQPDITPITVTDDDLPVAIVLRNVDSLSKTSYGDENLQQTPSSNWVQGDSAEDILQSLLDLALPDTESFLTAETKSPESETPELSLPLIVNLEAQTYISRWGVPLTIAGNVEINLKNGQTNVGKYYYQHVSDVKIRLDVRSPQQLEVLASIEESLGAEEIVPFPVRLTCQIPGDCESKLLLGDIYVYGILDGVGESMLLASQSFTIAADLNSLLAISAAAKPSAPDMDYPILAQAPPPPPPTSNSSSLDLELFNLVKTTKIGETANINHSPIKLSPKITLPLTVETKNSPPADSSVQTDAMDSPNIGKQAESSTPDLGLVSSLPFLRKISLHSSAEVSPVQSSVDEIINRSFPEGNVLTDTGESQKEEIANIDSDVVPDADISIDTIAQQPHPSEQGFEPDLASTGNKLEAIEEFTALEPLGIETELIENSEDATIIPTVFVESISGSELPFDSMENMSPLLQKWVASQNYGNLSDRNLIYPLGREQSEPSSTGNKDYDDGLFEPPANVTVNRQRDIFIPGSRTEENISTPIPPSPPLVYPSLQQQPPRPWIAKEIIIEDEEFEPSPSPLVRLNRELEESQELEADIPENLPTPILHLLPGDLIAGCVVRVRVELPHTFPQIAVKVWMEDCQTRTLLEGPHLLATLLPNNKGGVETIAQMNVPFGSIQVQIGAIAIHLTSQRESHKASLQRRVIPPDLPKLEINQMYGI